MPITRDRLGRFTSNGAKSRAKERIFNIKNKTGYRVQMLVNPMGRKSAWENANEDGGGNPRIHLTKSSANNFAERLKAHRWTETKLVKTKGRNKNHSKYWA